MRSVSDRCTERTRRTAETATHLVEHVFPQAAIEHLRAAP